MYPLVQSLTTEEKGQSPLELFKNRPGWEPIPNLALSVWDGDPCMNNWIVDDVELPENKLDLDYAKFLA